MNSTNPYASPSATEGFDHPPENTSPFRRIINVGLRLYFKNLVPIAVVTLLFWIPLEIFQAYMQYFVIDPDDFRSPLRLKLAISYFIGVIPVGAVITIQNASLRGGKISVWEGLDQGFSAWPRLFWSNVVRAFVLLLAFFALIVPGFYYFVRLALVDQIAVLEHKTGFDCIKRAHQFSTNHFLLLLSVLLVSRMPIFFLPAVLVVPLHLFPEINHWLLYAAISVVVDFLMPISTSLLAVVYYDFLNSAQTQAPATTFNSTAQIVEQSIATPPTPPPARPA